MVYPWVTWDVIGGLILPAFLGATILNHAWWHLEKLCNSAIATRCYESNRYGNHYFRLYRYKPPTGHGVISSQI